VFATDNESTRRIFLAAKTQGLRVTDQISLLGFDDLDWTTMVEPQISVVAQSPLLMGRMAGERLFARIKGDVGPKRRIVLPTQLVIRASTGTRAEQDGSDEP
jgi:LacI family transcriptional regulator